MYRQLELPLYHHLLAPVKRLLFFLSSPGRWITLLWLGFALILVIPLGYLHLTASPLQINTTEGKSTIFFQSDRNYVLFPNECVVVRWQVEQIRAVYLDAQGRIGSGEQESCTFKIGPTLRVEFPDGSTKEFRLPVERLYQHPLILSILLGLVASTSVFAYRLGGTFGLLAILIIAIFGPMLRNYANLNGDFITHTFFASAARDSGNINFLPPQFLFHVLTIEVNSIVPSINLETAGFLVMLSAYVLTAISAYLLIRFLSEQTERNTANDFVFSCLALIIMLSGPVMFLTPPAPNSALIQFNSYHSPTIGLLKPFAVTLFLLLLRLLPLQGTRLHVLSIGLVVLTVLSTLAKPSYTLAIVPIVSLLVLLSSFFPIRVPRLALILGVIVPALVVLGWQYLFLYGTEAQSTVYNSSEAARIVFAPLELFLTWWRTPWYWILPELILSLLFPLVVYAVYFAQARRHLALNLAWATCLVGVSLSYLFIERPRESDGNLVWSGQITVFILFLTTTGFWLKQNGISNRLWHNRHSLLCAFALALHAASYLSVLIRRG